MTRAAILVFGEALVDLVPVEGGQPEEILGGSGFNTALALARCGARVAYNASLSRDARGRLLRARIDEEGIDPSLIGDCDGATPTAAIDAVDAEGQASYRFTLAGTAFDVAPPSPEDLSGFAHLHVTSFGALIGPSGGAALALMQRARGAGLSISYDLNIRPGVLPGVAETRRLVEERVALCDLVKASAEDIEWLYEGDEALDSWRDLGAKLRLLTMGGAGAHLEWAERGWMHGFATRTTVVDTIGAGDAFMAAFLETLLSGGGFDRFFTGFGGSIDYDFAQDLLYAAAAYAASTCTVRGCDPPRRHVTNRPA